MLYIITNGIIKLFRNYMICFTVINISIGNLLVLMYFDNTKVEFGLRESRDSILNHCMVSRQANLYYLEIRKYFILITLKPITYDLFTYDVHFNYLLFLNSIN